LNAAPADAGQVPAEDGARLRKKVLLPAFCRVNPEGQQQQNGGYDQAVRWDGLTQTRVSP